MRSAISPVSPSTRSALATSPLSAQAVRATEASTESGVFSPCARSEARRPCEIHRLLLRRQQCVDLADQRQHFRRVGFLDLVAGAMADRLDVAAQLSERPQAEPHLRPGGGHQHGAEDGQRDGKLLAEAADRFVQYGAVLRDGDPVGPLSGRTS